MVKQPNSFLNRRQLLTHGLAGGAALALPALDRPARAADTALAATAPVIASTLTPYQRRVRDVALREHARVAQHLAQHDLVAVADFAQPSSLPRLHFVDVQAGTLRSFLVAHGKGSDPEGDGWLKHFSNAVNSEATSRGAYLTGGWYRGKYGLSVRVTGLDADNSNALDRAIVMHPAWYAAPDMLAKWGKLGRSEGCFAMAPEQFGEALWSLADGHLLFADRIGEV